VRIAPLLLSLLLLPACATARSYPSSQLADVTLYDRNDGRELPVFRHHGKLYAAGEPGHEYEIRVDNRSGRRLLAVASVDGVNVISGQTADPDQSGYIVDGWGSLRIDGWRKSLDHVAAFYFTSLPDSYAARTGRPDDVGVIGVALFEERAPRPQPSWPWNAPEASRERSQSGDARAPEVGSAAPPSAKSAQEAPLGTGHGRSQWSDAQYADFERASDSPQQVISIYYDSWSHLAARGIVAQEHRWARREPQPFPGRFVPDP
jgi:hypothetical protein